MSNIFNSKNIAKAGSLYALYGAIVSSVIGFIFIFISLILIRKPNIRTESVLAIITDADCERVSRDDRYVWDCYSIDVEYTVNNIIYKGYLKRESSREYKIGESINIWYNPSNPEDDISFNKDSRKAGIIMLSVASIVISLSWLWYYFVSRNETLGMVSAGSMAVNTIFK